jgi:hypothetical protein
MACKLAEIYRDAGYPLTLVARYLFMHIYILCGRTMYVIWMCIHVLLITFAYGDIPMKYPRKISCGIISMLHIEFQGYTAGLRGHPGCAQARGQLRTADPPLHCYYYYH